MKPLIPLALGLLAALSAQAEPHAAWQQTQDITVPGPGLVRFEIPAATASASSPSLNDLRLVSPQGIETPYTIEWPQLATVQAIAVTAFRASLADHKTLLELEPGTDKAVRAVILETTATSFIKAALVEGSNDGTQWQPLAQNEVLFRQGNGTSRLRIPFPAGSWKHLRVTLNDDRAEAVAFTGASMELEQPATQVVPMPLTIQKREEVTAHTRLTVPLGAANLWLATIKLQASDPVFSRHVKVLANEVTIASQTLFRVALDGREASILEVPIHAAVPAKEVVLEIDNGDSPPLKINGVEATRYPVMIAFHVEAAGRWQLYTGNAAAHAPSYDTAALASQLRGATAVTAQVSTLVANPSFDKSAALPETGTAGAAIDLKGWAFRKLLTTPERGVIQVTLDIEALAHGSGSCGDLRLIQSGHQLPYLLQQTSDTREVDVSLTPSPDPKRPTVSRWQLKLPVAGMPLRSLSAISSTALFTRHMSLVESWRDSYGNATWETLGSASWSQKPGPHTPLNLPLMLRPRSDTAFLETDNGDNAPLQVDKVTVSHTVTRCVFKTTDPAPIYLYYGNPEAFSPRYDLSLAAAELNAATPIAASLAAEEALKPRHATAEESGKGSPWLWAVLALVVGGLLWLVAKLLPATEAEK